MTFLTCLSSSSSGVTLARTPYRVALRWLLSAREDFCNGIERTNILCREPGFCACDQLVHLRSSIYRCRSLFHHYRSWKGSLVRRRSVWLLTGCVLVRCCSLPLNYALYYICRMQFLHTFRFRFFVLLHPSSLVITIMYGRSHWWPEFPSR